MTLITGSQGFVGSHLIQAIPYAVGIDNVDHGIKNNTIFTDLKDYDKLFWQIKDLGVDTVLHQAAIPSVPASYKDPIKTYANNVTASLNLIKICKILDIKKFVFASSSSVLGPSPYGHSKKVIEEVLHHCDMPYTVLRYFNVYGKGQRENIISIMYDRIKYDKDLTIFGDGETTRDFTYIGNVITANLKALDQKYNKQVLEVGTGEPHSLNEVYATLRNKVNPYHKKLIYGQDRIGDIKFSRASTFLGQGEITKFKEGINMWLSEMGH